MFFSIRRFCNRVEDLNKLGEKYESLAEIRLSHRVQGDRGLWERHEVGGARRREVRRAKNLPSLLGGSILQATQCFKP